MKFILIFLFVFESLSFANTFHEISIVAEKNFSYRDYSPQEQSEMLENWLRHILLVTDESRVAELFVDEGKRELYLPLVLKMRERIFEIPFIVRSLEFKDGNGISPSQYLGYAGEDDPLNLRNVNFTIKFMQMIRLYWTIRQLYFRPENISAIRGIERFLIATTMHEFLHGYDMSETPRENIRRNTHLIVEGIMTSDRVLQDAIEIFEIVEPRGFRIGSAVLDGYRGTKIDRDRNFPKKGNLKAGIELVKDFMLESPSLFLKEGPFYLLRPSLKDLVKIREERPESFAGQRGTELYDLLRENSRGVLNSMLSHYFQWDAETSYEGKSFEGMLEIMFWGQVRPLMINKRLVEINLELSGNPNLSDLDYDKLRAEVDVIRANWKRYMENHEVLNRETGVTVSEALFKNNAYLKDPLLGIRERYAQELEKIESRLASHPKARRRKGAQTCERFL